MKPEYLMVRGMRRVYSLLVVVAFIVSMLPAQSVGACFNPSDLYSVEVLLNKPGVEYNLSPAVPPVMEIEGKTFLLRVWNGSKGLHVWIGIPTVRHLGAYWVYSGTFILTSDALEKLRALGWIVNGSKLIKGNATFRITDQGWECKSDSDCATGGCSGEVCGRKGEVEKIVTPCVYAPWYECFQLTSCGCVNGTCSWKPNPEFEKCLRSHGVDPSKVIRAGPTGIVGKAPDPEDLREAVEELLKATGINCTKIEVQSRSEEGPAYDTSEVNASMIMMKVLEELIARGVVRGLTEEDIEEIAEVSEWGNAGWNSHIGWYETKNGTYAWIPYDESKDPLLVRFVGCGAWDTGNGSSVVSTDEPGTSEGLQHGTPEHTGSPSPSSSVSDSVKALCGPGLITLLSLWALMIVRRRK